LFKFVKVYVGDDPPFVGVAVKVTGVPEVLQIEVEDDASETEGVTFEFTVTGVSADEALWQPFASVTCTV
jgi:hypothetical protein